MSGSTPEKPDALVSLARHAIEAYVADRQVLDAEAIAGLEPRRAGVFVSLHLPDGSLRGCIGTFQPTRTTIEEEIVRNAISAATRDPRFYPLEPSEVSHLDVSVDVLGEPEAVSGIRDLDPKVYGIIIQTADGRQALLLPDLEGVDTPEQQIEICRQKGGIGPDEAVKLYRFEVKRYH